MKLTKFLLLLVLLPALAFAQSESDVNVIPDNQRHDARFIPERRNTDRTSDSTGAGSIWFNSSTRTWKGDLGNGTIFSFSSPDVPSFAAQAANTVFAGPTSGASLTPAFRALVSLDIPSLDAGKITSGTFNFARIPNLSLVPTGLAAGCVQIAGGFLTSTGVACGSGSGGTGTVTSFSAGDLSPLFTTAEATATTTPSLSFSPVSQSQNLFYASPNGSSGNPSFRAIASTDVPVLDAGKITTGTFGAARIPNLNLLATGVADGCLHSASGVMTSTGVACGAGSGGITSLGGLTGATQTFVNDTNVTMASAGTAHTLGWTGVLSLARGGTGANSAATARTSLGLDIGTQVQAFDADLSTLAALAKTDNNLIVANGTTWILAQLPSCSDATNSKLLYNTTTRTFTCGTDQAGAGGGTPGGSDKNVQFNNAGAFGGIANNATATAMYLKQVSSATPSFAQIAAAEISGLAASATTDTTNATNITTGTLADAQIPGLETLSTALADGCVGVESNLLVSSGAPCGTTAIPTFDEIFDADPVPTITGATEAKPFIISGNDPDYGVAIYTTTTNSPQTIGKCGGIIGNCDRTFPHNTGKTTSFLDESGNVDIRYSAATGVLEALSGQIIATSGDSATGFFTSGTIDAARLPTPATVVKSVQLTAVDYATDITATTGKAYFRVPSTLNNYIMTAVQANVVTAGTGLTTIRLTRCNAAATANICSGTTVNMFTVDLTIDASENDSSTAAAAVDIDEADDDILTGQVIRADVISVTGTAPKGLIINMDFTAP